jgi:hypothetical protein
MALTLTRRRVIAEPPSRLAIVARRLAVFSLAVVLLAIVIERADLLEITPVLMTFGAALALALLAILVAIASFVTLWRHGGPGFAQAMTAVVIGLAMLAYPSYLGYKGYSLPAIKDITTDPIDPPRFEVVARVRPPNSNIYPGLATAELQKEAWPDIDPLLVTVNSKIVFDLAVAVVTKRKWRIVNARPPQTGRDGVIEAIARTPIMGFRDDVVVRVRAVREGARVDVRSASRYGYTDFGTNAERVLALLDEIDDAASAEKPERQERPAKPPPKAAVKPAQPARR